MYTKTNWKSSHTQMKSIHPLSRAKVRRNNCCYKELPLATEMSPFISKVPMWPCFRWRVPWRDVSPASWGPRHHSFLQGSALRSRGLLRCLHPGVLQAEPVVVCCPQQTLPDGSVHEGDLARHGGHWHPEAEVRGQGFRLSSAS